jgi:hypothetical protein
MRDTIVPIFVGGLALFAIGCDDGDGLDASPTDSGVVDSGVRTDSGAPADSGHDSGPLDAGPNDAEIMDAIILDAMPSDSGPLLDAGCVAPSPTGTPAYVALPAPGRPRYFHGAALLPDGEVLLAGGYSDGLAFDPDVELFDPIANTIGVGAPRPSGYAFAEAVPLSDGRIFVSSSPTLPALIYDAAAGWTESATTSPNVYGPTLVGLSDGRVLAIGGFVDGASIADVRTYDPATDTWSRLLQMREPRVGAAAVRLEDGRVLVIGGSFRDIATDTTELIDVATATTSPGPSLMVERIDPQAVQLLDRRILVMGGEPLGGPNSEIYDPTTNRFTIVQGSTPPLKVGSKLVRLCDGRVAELGGRNYNNPISDSIAWIFDPSSSRWAGTTARMPTRQYPSATLLRDGRVLVWGGSVLPSDGPQVAGAQLFVP